MRVSKITGWGIALALGMTGVAGSAALAADRVQDRLHDGTCVADCVPQQDRDRLLDQDQVMLQDQVKLQDQVRLKDGSCLDESAQVRTRTRSGEQRGELARVEGNSAGQVQKQAQGGAVARNQNGK